MQTETPVLNEEICCWMYIMNPSEGHLLMAMRVWSGTFAMCMAMSPLEWRESVPTSSGDNPSMAAALRTVMTMEALTKQRL